MSVYALSNDFAAEPGWDVESKLRDDLAAFCVSHWGHSVDVEVPVPGVGTCDLVVWTGVHLIAIEVKIPRSVAQISAAGGQAQAYAVGLGADRVAVAVDGEGRFGEDRCSGVCRTSLLRVGVELWSCLSLFGTVDDVYVAMA